jgi:hypothetical protein
MKVIHLFLGNGMLKLLGVIVKYEVSNRVTV